MASEKLLPGTRKPKPTNSLAIALTLLSALAVTDVTYAASRVFFDDFEDGTTNKWVQDPGHNLCKIVTMSTDGLQGPYAGSKMVRCNWDSADYESLKLVSVPYTNEIFYRVRIRVDTNVERTNGSPLKMLRIYYWTGDWNTYRDFFTDSVPGNSCSNRGNAGSNVLNTYWGGAPGDNTCDSESATWHKIEYHFNHTTGTIKVWHDGILIRNDTVNFNNQKWLPFFISSNYSDSHDNTNHIYFDNIEIFSDAGTGATGLMSNATISALGSGDTTPPTAPMNLRVQ